MAKTIIGINNPSHEDHSPKCHLDRITLPQWKLMVARPQVQGIENLGLTKGIKDFLQ
jgi:hypothetical protein